MAHPAQAAQEQRLRTHPRQRQRQADCSSPHIRPAPPQRRSQHQKHRREEQPVSRLIEAAKQQRIQPVQRRSGDQPVVAVPQQAQRVERTGDSQRQFHSTRTEQSPCDAQPQHGRGQVPQVIERSVKQQRTQACPEVQPVQRARIGVQRQIGHHRRAIHHRQPVQLPPQPCAVAQVYGHEAARRHEEKRHRHAPQHAGEPEVRLRIHSGQRRRVNGHHQQRRDPSKPVQRGKRPPPAHFRCLQSVTMQPSTLFPDT